MRKTYLYILCALALAACHPKQSAIRELQRLSADMAGFSEMNLAEQDEAVQHLDVLTQELRHFHWTAEEQHLVDSMSHICYGHLFAAYPILSNLYPGSTLTYGADIEHPNAFLWHIGDQDYKGFFSGERIIFKPTGEIIGQTFLEHAAPVIANPDARIVYARPADTIYHLAYGLQADSIIEFKPDITGVPAEAIRTADLFENTLICDYGMWWAVVGGAPSTEARSLIEFIPKE